MSKAVDNSGPAFPKPGSDYSSGDQEGMSLRDYFAGQAMQVFLAGDDNGENPWREADLASACYRFADAMIEARKAVR